MNLIFDSAAVNPAAVFAFGLDPVDWDRAAEASFLRDAIEAGSIFSTGPLSAPAVEPAGAGRYEAPSAADRRWWAAQTLGATAEDCMVEGESVRRSRRIPAEVLRRAEDDLRWAAHFDDEAARLRRMEAEAA